MSNSTIRVLVVDDSVIYRKLIRNLILELPFIEVIGVASNGDIALQMIEQETPDLITLDIEMPMVNGLEVLQTLKKKDSKIGTLMLSSATSQGAKATTQALALGAFDFVLKPSCSSYDESYQQIKEKLFPKLEAFYRSQSISKVLSSVEPEETISVGTPDRSIAKQFQNSLPDAQDYQFTNQVQALGIGISTGGPAALSQLVPRLDSRISVPVFIVQHMPPVFTKSLAEDLNSKSSLPVVEPQNRTEVTPGTVYIAPGGQQMKVVELQNQKVIRLTNDPPECSCRPSVDYLFRSLANVYQQNTLGIIMTGMGEDGMQGCKLLKRKQAKIIAQDEASCVVFGMPRTVIENGLADMVVNLEDLPNVINQAIRREPIRQR